MWAVFILYSFDTYFSNFTIVAAAVAIAVADLLSLCVFSLFYFIQKAYLSYDALRFNARTQTHHILHCNVGWANEIQ